MAIRVIVTIGTVDVSEEFTFQSTKGLKWGDTVQLRVTHPMNAQPYGQAIVKDDGTSLGNGVLKYKATRVN